MLSLHVCSCFFFFHIVVFICRVYFINNSEQILNNKTYEYIKKDEFSILYIYMLSFSLCYLPQILWPWHQLCYQLLLRNRMCSTDPWKNSKQRNILVHYNEIVSYSKIEKYKGHFFIRSVKLVQTMHFFTNGSWYFSFFSC